PRPVLIVPSARPGPRAVSGAPGAGESGRVGTRGAVAGRGAAGGGSRLLGVARVAGGLLRRRAAAAGLCPGDPAIGQGPVLARREAAGRSPGGGARAGVGGGVEYVPG